MKMAYQLGKEAVDLATLRRATGKLAKPYLMRGGQAITGLETGDPKLIVRSSRGVRRHGGIGPTYMPKVMSDPETKETLEAFMPGGSGIPSAAGHIMTGGGLTNTLKQMDPEFSRLSGKNKEVLDRVGLMHEVFERHAAKKLNPSQLVNPFNRWKMHVSPEVLLREHNLVTTLPREHDLVRAGMRGFRDMGGETGAIKEAIPAFEYGAGPRFSRHAIKNLTRILQEKHRTTESPALIQQMYGLAAAAPERYAKTLPTVGRWAKDVGIQIEE